MFDIEIFFIKELGGLDAALKHGGPHAEILLLDGGVGVGGGSVGVIGVTTAVSGIGRRGVAWEWGEMSLFCAIGLADFPLRALRVDERCKIYGIAETGRREIAIAADFTGQVIDRFTVTGDPDLTGCQVEVEEVVNGLSGEETTNLVGDDFTTNVDHLDEGHVVAFFVVTDTDVVLFVQGDTFLKIFERLVRVLILVVRP